MRNRRASLVLGLSVLLAGQATAGNDVLEAAKGLLTAAAIRDQAGNIDKLLDAVTLRFKYDSRAATRVVPGYSVGRKTYVGAYQVTGPTAQLERVHAVFEVTGQVEGGKGRFAHLIPATSANPLKFDRVRGVSVVAAVDMALFGNVGTHPVGGSSRNDLLRAGEAVAASLLVGKGLDSFLNRVNDHPPGIPTRVVPILTVGEKSYVGMAQVMGMGAAGVDAVLLVDESLSPKFRARVMFPVNLSRPGLRVADVGVGTVIDMVLHAGARPAGAVVVPVPRPPPPQPVVVIQPVEGPPDHTPEEVGDDRWVPPGHRKHGKWKSREKDKKGKKKGKGPPPWSRGRGHDDDDEDDDHHH